MLWALTAIAAPPQLHAWVTESEGRPQLAVILELGAKTRWSREHTYTIELQRDARPAGRIQCALTEVTTLRCRIEGPGEQCPSCGTVLDVPLGSEAAVPGVRAFAGRRTAHGPSEVLVFQIDAERFGAPGLLTATGTIEQLRWAPESPRVAP